MVEEKKWKRAQDFRERITKIIERDRKILERLADEGYYKDDDESS